MKTFLVLFSQKNKGNLQPKVLEGHVAFLKKLKRLGCLVICGPFTDDQRGMIVLRCANQEKAAQLISEDPFVEKKYYAQWEIAEFMEANEENGWLASHPQTKGNVSDTP